MSHPVIEVLTSRLSNGSLPGKRADKFRVGLAVEGGGMRGVLSGAMLAALDDCGLTNSFDAIYAYSSGAINSAYFISGGGWHSLSVYYDDLVSDEFLSYRRLLKRESMVSLDFVFDVVMEERNPLDYQRLLASPIELKLIASSIDQVKPHIFDNLTTKSDIKTALKASSSIPLLAGSPVVFRGERFVDGAVLLSHPFLAAKADDCTHVVVIRTRSDNSSAGRFTLGKRLMAQRLEHLQQGMKEAVRATVEEYTGVANEVRRRSLSGAGQPYVIEVSAKGASRTVGRFTQDQVRIYQGMRESYGAMLEAVTGEKPRVLLRPANAFDRDPN